MENPKLNLSYIIRKWRTKSTPHCKGGNFNLKLYLDYLSVTNDNLNVRSCKAN
jgi:hypothetical protein